MTQEEIIMSLPTQTSKNILNLEIKASPGLFAAKNPVPPVAPSQPNIAESYWDSIKTWMGAEAVPGVKNGYLAGGGGFLLLLALATAGRRR
jgi:hypothetical protein